MNIFKSFRFSLAKKRSRSRPKILAPAPAKIFKSAPAPEKNLGSNRLRLRNTGVSQPFFAAAEEKSFIKAKHKISLKGTTYREKNIKLTPLSLSFFSSSILSPEITFVGGRREGSAPGCKWME